MSLLSIQESFSFEAANGPPNISTPFPSVLNQENMNTLQWKGEQNEPSIPSVTSPSRCSVRPPPSVPMSSYYAVTPHELPDQDWELIQVDINLIVLLLLAQSKDFNEAEYCNLLVKHFD